MTLTATEIVEALCRGRVFSKNEIKSAIDTLEAAEYDATVTIQDPEVQEHDKGYYRNELRTYRNAIAQLKAAKRNEN